MLKTIAQIRLRDLDGKHGTSPKKVGEKDNQDTMHIAHGPQDDTRAQS